MDSTDQHQPKRKRILPSKYQGQIDVGNRPVPGKTHHSLPKLIIPSYNHSTNGGSHSTGSVGGDSQGGGNSSSSSISSSKNIGHKRPRGRPPLSTRAKHSIPRAALSSTGPMTTGSTGLKLKGPRFSKSSLTVSVGQAVTDRSFEPRSKEKRKKSHHKSEGSGSADPSSSRSGSSASKAHCARSISGGSSRSGQHSSKSAHLSIRGSFYSYPVVNADADASENPSSFSVDPSHGGKAAPPHVTGLTHRILSTLMVTDPWTAQDLAAGLEEGTETVQCVVDVLVILGVVIALKPAAKPNGASLALGGSTLYTMAAFARTAEPVEFAKILQVTEEKFQSAAAAKRRLIDLQAIYASTATPEEKMRSLKRFVDERISDAEILSHDRLYQEAKHVLDASLAVSASS